MIITQATDADAQRIGELGEQFYLAAGLDSTLGPYDRMAVENIKNIAYTIVGKINGEVVGFAAGIVYPHFLQPSVKVGQELMWWVEPEHRSSGVGKKIMVALEEWSKSEGAQSFSMITLHGLGHEMTGEIYKAAGYSPLEYVYMKRFD